MRKKLHFFAINHDYIKLFVMFYVIFSAILAVFFGLFYFLVWILFHMCLEVYKRHHIFGKFDFEDFLIVLKHCKIDLVFFVVGWCSEVLAHFTFAIALSTTSRFVFSSEVILESFVFLPRVVGTAKVAKSVFHVLKEIITEKEVREEARFRASKGDYITALVCIISITSTVSFLLFKGYSLEDVLREFLKALEP